MDRALARRELVRGLALAAAGERGAIRAYLGHRVSLPHGDDRRLIVRILKDEVHHRREILAMLQDLGGELNPRAERRLDHVGRAIAAFCLRGGWFLPMAGAARLECDNVVEFELLARFAWWAGERGRVEALLQMAEVEWDHELWLRERAQTHALWRFVLLWPTPPPRDTIRARFAEFVERPTPVRRRASLLLR
jgi:hypothetical protein